MNIIFTEVQAWEKEILTEKFPNAVFLDEKISLENVKEYENSEILCCFIYSEITNELLDNLPNLKYIVTRSTGFDHIDINACTQRNIFVSNVPEYGSNTVAEFTFALLLDVARKVTQSITQAKQVNFDHMQLRGVDLCKKTIGVIGLGKIGKNVVKIAQGFGMNILVYNRSQDQELAKNMNFSYVDLESLLQQSDVITLHVPLDAETTHLINKDNILKCKKGSILINTARGGLIDTQAILLALQNDILAGVGLDVLEGENELIDEVAILHRESKNVDEIKTILLNHILLNHPKVLITPHNAFNSQEALLRILDVSIENIHTFIDQKKQNLINKMQ